ncbi:uncharacterized protein SAPINGB_P000441 [Magnusiomyces paraingens]|uniref:Mitochondrial intermediate peptidase n=1 Tax=Magnusiomyces paraingens TaxID=2606893 RepID=A0A5E8AZC2_9ASCO|nr:uncharacterized protein SAPINGB_P000441 [Saprochaete ingens]VVT44512.1 unnamed protein product [Saprochaete ingens]
MLRLTTTARRAPVLVVPRILRRQISLFTPINDKPGMTAAAAAVNAQNLNAKAPTIKLQTPRDEADARHGDAALRLMFDDAGFWKSMSPVHNPGKKTGLFDNPYLTSPRGMLRFTEVSLAQAQALAQRILSGTVRDGGDLVRTLDRLSDTLCQVIDLMGCVRAAHPAPGFQAAAQQAHETMFEYMNVLNTSVELYDRLAAVFEDPEKVAKLSAEEDSTGRLLLADFEKSGIRLDPETRTKFVQLMNVISVMGQEFMEAAAEPPKDPSVAFVKATSSDLEGLDRGLARYLVQTQQSKLSKLFGEKEPGSLLVPTTGWEAAVALRTVRDEKVRREIWTKGHLASADLEQDNRLQTILRARGELANLMGAPSYAAYELHGKMLKTPALADSFLKAIEAAVAPKARGEIAALARIKAQATDVPHKTAGMEAWDRDFFGARFLHQQHLLRDHRDDTPSQEAVARIPEYFSVGTVIQGLSRLFTSIYGIRFEPVPPKEGETWRDDVRRVNVVSDTDGLVGVMYCDLFQAPGKSPNPAHFTVRCSRRIYAAENDAVRALDPLANERFPHVVTGRDAHQLPVIVLMCDFAPGPAGGPALLTFNNVQTLFHEMGHAMHSMLGRTDLHNVSGTRCATDFVELPSVLMEKFAAAPQVLGLFAYHHATGAPLPLNLLQEHERTAQQLLQHSETHAQIVLALLDQLFHSGDPALLATPEGLHHAYYALESHYGLFPAQRESRWYTQFGHLVGYGASYYCYLLGRAIADRVWAHVFQQDPTARDAGEKWRREVLQWGGSKDPWQMVASVLDDPTLAPGDTEAIASLTRGFDSIDKQ